MAAEEAAPRKSRILVVEDDSEMRALLVKALSTRQREVTPAPDGAQAIEELGKDGTFDLIISDIRMPNRGGHAVLSEVRQKYPSTKVILITAFGEIEEYLDAMDRGAYEYINKPLKLAELMRVVDRALG